METIITLLQDNPSVAVWVSVAAIVFARYGLYPFFIWLSSLSTTNQAIVTANSADQRSSDAITTKALDIIADNSTATTNMLRQYGADITHIRHTTDRHYAEFRSSDFETRLRAIEHDVHLIRKDTVSIKKGTAYIVQKSIKEKTA